MLTLELFSVQEKFMSDIFAIKFYNFEKTGSIGKLNLKGEFPKKLASKHFEFHE